MKDTAEFYNTNNRAVKKGTKNCVYYEIDNSPGCAIGRFCLTPRAMPSVAVDNYTTFYFLNYIPDWMREMEMQFLRSVQNLHDNEDHWNNDGITEFGKSYVNSVCRAYQLDLIYETPQTQNSENP